MRANPHLRFFGLALLAAALLLPSAAAHAAPEPRAFETRVLHDHNDDSLVVLAGKHGFDTIALDVREGGLAGTGDVLILRLILNDGCNEELPTSCPTLREVVRFEGPGGPVEVTFETADGGLTWTGNAARYGSPEPLNDGTRFAIEAWVPFAAFGGAVGSELGDWFVEGYAGEDTADDMPAGLVAGVPDPLGAAFDIGTYTLGSVDYIRIEGGADAANATGDAGATVDVPLRVANLVALEQQATFNISGPARLLASSNATEDLTTLALAPNFTADLVLRITLPSGNETITVTAATPLGGLASFALDAAGVAPQPEPSGNETHTDDHEGSKDTPAAGPLLAAAALAVALVGRRRRT